ncbi:hypothetical protein, partial [Streptomyces sp. RKCA744]|uniref:hypothetical protein n=1 Tax=Streptomyces sp. RKCA744 TaxID=2959340 RepID=UPI00209DD1EC
MAGTYVGGAGLGGVLPGLRSGMVSGSYASRQLGQVLDLPGIVSVQGWAQVGVDWWVVQEFGDELHLALCV